MNSFDEDVERLLSFFSDYEIEDIKKLCKEDIRKAKKIMAFEVTKLVHGEEEALKIKKASEEIFENSGNSQNTEIKEIDKNMLENGINIIELLIFSELFSSKSEARRMLEQNGVSINNIKINDANTVITNNDFYKEELLIQKGKKNFLKIRKINV